MKNIENSPLIDNIGPVEHTTESPTVIRAMTNPTLVSYLSYKTGFHVVPVHGPVGMSIENEPLEMVTRKVKSSWDVELTSDTEAIHGNTEADSSFFDALADELKQAALNERAKRVYFYELIFVTVLNSTTFEPHLQVMFRGVFR